MDLHHRLFGTPIAADDDDRWAASGAMALTGSEAPSLPPRSLMPVLRSLETELALRTAELGTCVELDAAALLGERAAIAGLARRGRTSCGGSTASCLPVMPGWRSRCPALTTSRSFRRGWGPMTWRGIKAGDPGELVEAAALLGLACGRLGEDVCLMPCRALGASQRGAATGQCAARWSSTCRHCGRGRCADTS